MQVQILGMEPVMNPYLATLFTFVIAIVFLRLMDLLAHRGWIESRLSRKFIHIGTGPIFVLCWLMYPDLPISRWLAALVPLLITAQFVLVGTGVIRDEAAVKAMSRTGDRREILRGPLSYGIVFVAVTLLYWKDSLIGIPAQDTTRLQLPISAPATSIVLDPEVQLLARFNLTRAAPSP